MPLRLAGGRPARSGVDLRLCGVESAALTEWRGSRAERLDRLSSAQVAAGAGRRLVTEELHHAILLRLASEFQGFCRDLHDEAIAALVTAAAPEDPRLRQVLTVPFVANRRLDRGNAEPGALGTDFGLLGMTLWPDLKARYPAKGAQWQRKLELLIMARNAIAHDDVGKLARVAAAGWSVGLTDIRRWRAALDGLAVGMDHVTREHLHRLVAVTPW